MHVPFFDLKSQYAEIKAEVTQAILGILEDTSYILGPSVDRFEKEFAEYLGASHVVAVNSGTSALHLALVSLGINSRSEVITVPNTFIATAEAIAMTAATPVFVDVEEDSLNIDPEKLEAVITDRTKAIIPVHLFGRPANMEPILTIAKKYGLAVIEDACQAHGAKYNERMVGTLGEVAAFSFYPSKNLGAFGEGGAVVTQDAKLVRTIRALRDHGQFEKDNHQILGYNCRMSGFQGATLGVKLKYLDKWTNKRRQNADLYTQHLCNIKNITLPPFTSDTHVYHLYVIRAEQRDQLMNYLLERGVQTRIHYPKCLHLQGAFSYLGYKQGDFPVAEKASHDIISLPMYPELSIEAIKFISESIKTFYSQ